MPGMTTFFLRATIQRKLNFELVDMHLRENRERQIKN